jgi:hypothetical protein
LNDSELHAPHFDFNGKKGRMFQRLGAALAFRWDDVPEDVQQMLVEQAELVFGFGPEGQTDDKSMGAIQEFIKYGMRKTTVGK